MIRDIAHIPLATRSKIRSAEDFSLLLEYYRPYKTKWYRIHDNVRSRSIIAVHGFWEDQQSNRQLGKQEGETHWHRISLDSRQCIISIAYLNQCYIYDKGSYIILAFFLFGKTCFGLNSYCIQYHIMATYIAPLVHKWF